MPSKSIWRSDKAQHFQLVHRSQQDPLAYDAESSSRVLKPTKKEQRPQTRADLERELGDYARNQRANVGEAAQYGILFDDTEYDYMQHLRAVGDDYHKRRGGEDVEDDTEVIMLEAPKTSQARGKGKAKDADVIQLKEDASDAKDKQRVMMQLPKEVLPSEIMMPRTFESEEDKGLRPDMDPHLRQVLEALEDDAFLMRTAGSSAANAKGVSEGIDFGADDFDEGDEEDIDDFFSGIVKEGELGQNEDPEWRHLPPEGEETLYEDQGAKAARELMQLKAQGGGIDDLSLESRVALFKKAQEEQHAKAAEEGAKNRRVASSTGSQSIFGEKGASRRSRHPGAKARLAATYYAPSIEGGATAFSMSSSAMERNQGLTGLDEQFDRMEKIYEQGSDEEEEEEGAEESRDTPADIDAIFDDFLNNNEIVGNKLRERLGDRQTTSSEKVDILRKELGDVRLIDKLSIDEADDDRESYDEVIMNDLRSRDAIRQEWDVQTVLTTRTNLENHPKTIASATSHLPRSLAFSGAGKVNGSIAGSSTSRIPRVRINPRTGVPEVTSYIDPAARSRQREQMSNGTSATTEGVSDGEESDASSADTEVPQHVTITRDRNESKEEKKARKQAVKDQKKSARADKAARKQLFEAEMNKQKRSMGAIGANKHATAVRLS